MQDRGYRAEVDDAGALVPYGWDDATEANLSDAVLAAGWDPDDVVAGRVVRTSRRFTYVGCADGLVQATAPRELHPAPVAGDWVALRPGTEETGIPVVAVAERTSAVVRRDPAGGTEGQVLAANVDVVLAVFGLDRPLRAGRVERSMVIAHDSGAEPVVVLTKADTVEHAVVAEAVDDVRRLAGGAEVVVVSAAEGSPAVGPVADLLRPHRTAVLVGESGAGKSTLVNALAGREVQRTASVRGTDAKGRHTTVTRDLVVLDAGGVVIDTPGLRALGLVDTSAGVDATFDDIAELAEGCRFRDCAHRGEPGCAVAAAVAAGDLAPDRLERYLAVRDEIAEAGRVVTEAARRPRGRPAPPPD